MFSGWKWISRSERACNEFYLAVRWCGGVRKEPWQNGWPSCARIREAGTCSPWKEHRAGPSDLEEVVPRGRQPPTVPSLPAPPPPLWGHSWPAGLCPVSARGISQIWGIGYSGWAADYSALSVVAKGACGATPLARAPSSLLQPVSPAPTVWGCSPSSGEAQRCPRVPASVVTLQPQRCHFSPMSL